MRTERVAGNPTGAEAPHGGVSDGRRPCPGTLRPSGLSRAGRRACRARAVPARSVLFEQNRQRTAPSTKASPSRLCAVHCYPRKKALLQASKLFFQKSTRPSRAVAAAQHGRRALRTLAGEPGRHGHRRARAGLRGGLQASASECAPAVCTLAAVGGHSLSAAPLAVRRRWQGECCDEAGGGEGRHDGDGGAEHPQREAEGPRGRGPGGAPAQTTLMPCTHARTHHSLSCAGKAPHTPRPAPIAMHPSRRPQRQRSRRCDARRLGLLGS